MNDYQVVLERDGRRETVELVAENIRQIETLVPEDADIVEVRFLRARGFSCRPLGTLRRGA
ncbi:MAG: hypothetical protein RL434_2383 [Pseudomonadota bacterium]|jgi:hypothetical protein